MHVSDSLIVGGERRSVEDGGRPFGGGGGRENRENIPDRVLDPMPDRVLDRVLDPSPN